MFEMIKKFFKREANSFQPSEIISSELTTLEQKKSADKFVSSEVIITQPKIKELKKLYKK